MGAWRGMEEGEQCEQTEPCEQRMSTNPPSTMATERTLATAISKSSCVTCTRLSLKAYIPASVHTP